MNASKANIHKLKIPFRSLILGPNGSGKGVLLQRLILDVYKDVFARIYLMSPSIHVDHTWEPVKKYIKDVIKPNNKEKYLFDTYEPQELNNIIDRQHKVTKYLKDNGKQNYILY